MIGCRIRSTDDQSGFLKSLAHRSNGRRLRAGTRQLALKLDSNVGAQPCSCPYAGVGGILGGLFVGTVLMDFSILHYFEQTQTALNSMWEVYSGLIKSLAFGWIIGMVGCLRGLRCGNDSAALGQAVTSAVVTSITLVVVVDACFEVFYSMMDLR